MASVSVVKAVNAILFALDAAISMSDASKKLRKMAAKAIEEGRSLNDSELKELHDEAANAIRQAREND